MNLARRKHYSHAGPVLAAIAALIACGVVRAQQGDSPHVAWLGEPTTEAAEAALQNYLARLPAAERDPYLRAVGPALRGAPLQGPAAGRCMRAHLPLLAAHASTGPALVEWFVCKAADCLAARNDLEGALALLAEFDALVPDTKANVLPRRLLAIDWHIDLQQMAAADRRCAELESMAQTPLDRSMVLATRGSIDVMLGRLDLARRRLDAAADLLAGLEAAEKSPAERALRQEQFDQFRRRLDLLTASERFAAVRPEIERFVASREQLRATLDAGQLLLMDVHRAAADYHNTQHDPASVDAVLGTLAALRARPELESERTLLTLWEADLELRRGRTERAGVLLAAARPQATRRSRWLSAAIAAELARRSTADRAVLLQHEAELRAVLHEMVAEWREVAWENETTGFLRLGSRLRTLGELIAITTALHGAERALADVLTVQCCTTASRTRGAEPLSLAALRAGLLTDDHGVLVFVPAWNESHVFAFDRSRFVHEVLPRASELRRLVANLRTELLALDGEPARAIPLDALRDSARTLADRLLPPTVRQQMEHWRHVTITGGNLLGNPAFACLPWDEHTLLGEHFAIATISSLPLLARMQAEADAPVAAGALQARLFATLSPGPAFAERNRLGSGASMSGPSWERLLRQLPPGAVTLVDAAATPAAYETSSRASGHRFTLLVAHGEPASDGRPAALGLTPDPQHREGTLTPAEVRGVSERGLVMLAACHAARGPVRMGDDDVADSLAGAFVCAGATGVVASAAPLRANMYLDVAAGMLEALAEGATQAEALRRARLQTGAADLAQRYRAAQIELIGLGTYAPVQPPARSAWWLWLIGALLVGAILLRRAVLGCR